MKQYAYIGEIEIFNQILRFTNASNPITLNNNTYQHEFGFEVSNAINNNNEVKFFIDLFSDNNPLMDAVGVNQSIPLTLSIIETNSLTVVIQRQLTITHIQPKPPYLRLYFNPPNNFLNTTILKPYSHNCRAEFGNSECKKDPLSVSLNKTVIEHNNTQLILKSSFGANAQYFVKGWVQWKDRGEYFKIKITQCKDNWVQLETPPPISLTNAVLTFTPTCQKTLQDCKFYDNVRNFRGEPYLPDVSLIRYENTPST